MTDLLPCPFCGGEASDTGYQKWSRPLSDMAWEDGAKISEAYFCNCPSCSVSNLAGGVGYQSRAKAVSAWNTRPGVTVAEAAKDAADTLNLVADWMENAIVDRRIIGPEFHIPTLRKAAHALTGEPT